jgi:phosphoglycerate dehydrogenase-like enzyme
LAQADVLFDFDWEDPAHLLDHAPNLRWIQASGAGIGERVRQIGLPRDRILLTTSAGVHAGPLAEFALMAILYFAKDVPRLLEWQAKHHWERYCVRELAGSRALVLGLGGVGRRIAELYAALGIDVTGMRRSEADPLPLGVKRLIRRDLLDEVLCETDYLVIAVPYTRETHRLIDARRLSLLPPSAVLVNVGRGKVIDEPALIAALQDGRLHGAALDVFDQEPLPPESPLWGMPNILLSPHSTSIVERESERIVDLFIENLRRYMDGRPLLNRFDYERGY